MTAKPALSRRRPGASSDRELMRLLHSGLARCADSGLDPEEWFPLSADVSKARAQAANAIALCGVCKVRAECLEFALRQWFGAGGDGVWGGMVAAERRAIRRQWLGGANVTDFFAEEGARARAGDGVPAPRAGDGVSASRAGDGTGTPGARAGVPASRARAGIPGPRAGEGLAARLARRPAAAPPAGRGSYLPGARTRRGQPAQQ